MADDTIPDELGLAEPGESTLPNLSANDFKNPFVVACTLPAVESKILQLLNINPKIWQELKQKGVVPPKSSYGECLRAVFDHYRGRNDAAAVQAKLHAAKQGLLAEGEAKENNLSKLIEVEKIQRIRLDRAKVQEIHLKNLATRGDLLDKIKLYELIAPMMGTIGNILRSAADENPEVQGVIDKCFTSLFNIGEKLIEQADADKIGYVQHMLDTPLDLDNILNSEIPNG